MRLDDSDEDFIAGQIEGVRSAIEARAHGDVDRAWTLGRRLSGILSAQAHAHLAKLLGLAKASGYDTLFEVRVDGTRHAEYEAGFLRSEVWVALLGSVHFAIDDRALREEIMASERIGDDAVPWHSDQGGDQPEVP